MKLLALKLGMVTREIDRQLNLISKSRTASCSVSDPSTRGSARTPCHTELDRKTCTATIQPDFGACCEGSLAKLSITIIYIGACILAIMIVFHCSATKELLYSLTYLSRPCFVKALPRNSPLVLIRNPLETLPIAHL